MKLSRHNLILLLCGTAICLSVFAAAPGAHADSSYIPLAPIPGTGASGCNPANQNCSVTLGSYLLGIYKIGIAAAGVLAFLMIVLGGFTYLSTDAVSGKEEGRHRIMNAAGGLILALASWVILNAINPNLVSLNLAFGPPARSSTFSSWQPPPDTVDATYQQQLDQIRTNLKNAQGNVDTAQNAVNKANQALLQQYQPLLDAYSSAPASLSPDQKALAENILSQMKNAQATVDIARYVAAGNASIDRANANAGQDVHYQGQPAASQIHDAVVYYEGLLLSLGTADAWNAANQMVQSGNAAIVAQCDNSVIDWKGLVGPKGLLVSASNKAVLTNDCVSSYTVDPPTPLPQNQSGSSGAASDSSSAQAPQSGAASSGW